MWSTVGVSLCTSEERKMFSGVASHNPNKDIEVSNCPDDSISKVGVVCGSTRRESYNTVSFTTIDSL